MLGVSLPLWVKVAVQVSASTWVKSLRLPPATVTSLASKPATASLNWKVMVVLSPAGQGVAGGLGKGGGPGVGIDLGEVAQATAGHSHVAGVEAGHRFAELEGDGGAFTSGEVAVGGADDQGRSGGVGGQGQVVAAAVVAGQVGVLIVGDADARGVAAALGKGGGPGVGIDLGEVAQATAGHSHVAG